MTVTRSKREVRAEHPARILSKKLFGSQYRIETATAIDSREPPWTIDDLEESLPGVPRSCIVKEVKALVELGVVCRAEPEAVRGSIPYVRSSDLDGFWTLIEQARAKLGQRVVSLVRNESDSGA